LLSNTFKLLNFLEDLPVEGSGSRLREVRTAYLLGDALSAPVYSIISGIVAVGFGD